MLKQQDILLVFANVSAHLRDQFDRHGITEIVGASAIYGSVHAVIADHEDQLGTPEATTTAGAAGQAVP